MTIGIRIRQILAMLAITFGFIGLATLVGLGFTCLGIPETNVVLAYIVSVMMTARWTRGYGYGLLASCLVLVSFNYFFTAPIYTLKVHDPSYFITFALLLVTALSTSALTTRILRMASQAQEAELEARALFALTNQLSDAPDMATMAHVTTQTIASVIGGSPGFICSTPEGTLEPIFVQYHEGTLIHREVLSDHILERLQHSQAAPICGDEFCDWPVYGSEAIVGVVRLPVSMPPLLESQTHLLHAIIESTALAMDRLRSVQARIISREEASKERFRANLLRAISHDLRTPLASVMGTSEQLMHSTDGTSHDLAAGIFTEASRLHALVENILSLTRLQAAPLTTQPEAIEEILGVAIPIIESRYERDIAISAPDEVVLVPMDAKLITQVLINLLDNACMHTPHERPISVRVSLDEGLSRWEVIDEGTGIAPGDLPHIFTMFYTKQSDNPDTKRGVGLGLSIGESIVHAHGGQISARANSPRGTIIAFTLPLASPNAPAYDAPSSPTSSPNKAPHAQ